jgi:molybdopterin synthase catalytic subunit
VADVNPMIALRQSSISVQEIIDSVRDTGAGAVDLFLGTTRESSKGKKVLELKYEAYEPMVLQLLENLSGEACKRWNLKKVTIVHRTGTVAVGDISVAIAVAAVHRAEAFEACRWLIDSLKKEVPIWKKEIFADGSAWVDGTTV